MELQEQYAFLNTLTNVPHRELDGVIVGFENALRIDPDTAARAFVWMIQGGTAVRDHQEAAVIALLRGDPEFPALREAGRVSLLGSDFYRTNYPISGFEPRLIIDVDSRIRSMASRKSPRLMKAIMSDWLFALHADPKRWEGIALHNRTELKRVYHRHGLPRPPYVQQALFDNQPDAAYTPKLAAIKEINRLPHAAVEERAQLIVLHQIPFRIATALIGKSSIVGGLALLEVATPREVRNARGQFERLGLLEMPEVKRVFLDKSSANVEARDAASLRKRASTRAGSDREVNAEFDRLAAQASQQIGIEGDLLVLVDISSSQGRSIAAAREFLTATIAAITGDVLAIAFNSRARILNLGDRSLNALNQAFGMLRAQGMTNPGMAIPLVRGAQFNPSKVVIFTDGGENDGSNVARDLAQLYNNEEWRYPPVVMVRLPGDSDLMSARFRALNFQYEQIAVNDADDMYLLDQIPTLLKARRTMLDDILEIELPYRVWGKVR